MKIQKRNNSLVDYDSNRIISAIEKAMLDIGKIDHNLSKKIELEIYHTIVPSGKIWSVEEISDKVEILLIENNLENVAKSYISYRIRRANERPLEEKHTYTYLSKEFLSKYKHIDPPMTELGIFVFYRTYSRYLPEKKRREYWWETVARAVEYNCGLQPSTSRKEAEELYDNMFNLRQFLSGRTIWSGGTPTAFTNPISQYNCSGLVIDNFDVYKDICYLLMLGVGVGFGVGVGDWFT